MKLSSTGSLSQVPPDNTSTSSVESSQEEQQTEQTRQPSSRERIGSFLGHLCRSCGESVSRVFSSIQSTINSFVGSIRNLGQYNSRQSTGQSGTVWYDKEQNSSSPRDSLGGLTIQQADEIVYGMEKKYGASSQSSSSSSQKQNVGGMSQPSSHYPDPIYDLPRKWGLGGQSAQKGGGEESIYAVPKKPGQSSSSVKGGGEESIYAVPKKPGQSSSSVSSSSSSSSS